MSLNYPSNTANHEDEKRNHIILYGLFNRHLCINNLLAISEQCQTGRCNECLEILDQGVKCEHKCHLNTLDVGDTMDQSLKQQQAEQDKIETITPNEPHIA